MKAAITFLLSMIFCLSWNANAQQIEALSKRIQAMNEEKDPQMTIKAMQHIIRDFKLDTIKNVEDIDVLKGQVALSYLKAGMLTEFEYYIDMIKNKFNQTSYLNMAVYKLLENKKLDEAAVIAQQTITLYDSYKDNPSARPANFPLADWNRFMQMAAYPYYESYAEVLYAKGQNKKALFYQEQAIKGKELDKLMQSSIELYTALLEADKQTEKAYSLLLKMASVGKASINMHIQLKKLCTIKMGSETKANHFLDSIQKNINQLYQAEIEKKMISNVAAPNFNLLDLNGKLVSLVNLKGKIVVLDFWATWCAPCIASMPAMNAIAKRHPEVIFLFVATQEPGAGAAARVKSYIKKNKFQLNVLMDKPTVNNKKIFQAATAYKLKGIPAKMVIDRNGKLRFSTDGYLSDSELINELEAMITIAKTL